MKLSHWACLAIGAVLGASITRFIPWRSFPLVVVALVIVIGALTAFAVFTWRRL